ncbi:uncharacterized protein LOC144097405 [Amblyomma americanum]
MGRRRDILKASLWFSTCMVLVAGSSLLLCDDSVKHGMSKTTMKKAQTSGEIKSLMKGYSGCFRSKITRKLVSTYTQIYNTTGCVPDVNPDLICNDPTHVAEYYDCIFKRSPSAYTSLNATAEAEIKLKTFWKCMKDTFKRFQETYLSKR